MAQPGYTPAVAHVPMPLDHPDALRGGYLDGTHTTELEQRSAAPRARRRGVYGRQPKKTDLRTLQFGRYVQHAALAADENYFRAVMLLAQPKIKGIEELPGYTVYFFTDDFPIDAKVREKVLAKAA